MKNDDIFHAMIISDDVSFTLAELCDVLHVERAIIVEMIDYGIVDVTSDEPDAWVFQGLAFQRICVAVRLHRDLEISHAGLGLVLDMREELLQLRREVAHNN